MTARAFITGIGGQDGSYLAERLVNDGLEVHAMVLAATNPGGPAAVLGPAWVQEADSDPDGSDASFLRTNFPQTAAAQRAGLAFLERLERAVDSGAYPAEGVPQTTYQAMVRAEDPWLRSGGNAQALGALSIPALVVTGARAADGFVAVPAHAARVTDQAGMLNAQQRSALDGVLSDYERKTGSQIAILLVPSTAPEAIEQYSIRVAEAWKLGRKGIDDGVLLVVAKNNPSSLRRLRIEAGRGVQGTLTDAADSSAAERTVERLRADLKGTDALVGGVTATAVDTNAASIHDRNLIIPVILGVILLILMLLLRAVVAPVLLILTTVLSFGSAMGVAALVFNGVFRFPGADPAVPLFGFVFLVALGIDYNIFLMTRVREESRRHGTREGILRGLSVTGGVITSAGLVLAATFAALSVIPILFLVQIAFIVAFGVLLVTFVVRSLLVPALSYDLGRVIWWPSRLARRDAAQPEASQDARSRDEVSA